jgi:hypothetical protein
VLYNNIKTAITVEWKYIITGLQNIMVEILHGILTLEIITSVIYCGMVL